MSKNSIKINGSNFNKIGVAAMTKDEFVNRYMAIDEVFPNAKDKAKQLSEAYVLITGKKEKPLSKEEKLELDQ